MSSYSTEKNDCGGSVWMVSLMDVAFLRWTDKGADLLDKKMLEAQPKKLSSRSLARMTEETGYPVSHQTINSMRKGETAEVAPNNLIGVCRALHMDIKSFLSGPVAQAWPENKSVE